MIGVIFLIAVELLAKLGHPVDPTVQGVDRTGSRHLVPATASVTIGRLSAAVALLLLGPDLLELNPDGSPQVTVVWMALESTPEGDELVSAHLTEYQKTRNIRRDPRVAVTVLAARKPGQQTPYLAITGTARIVEGGAPELLKKLAKVMLGSDEHFPPPNAPEGLLTRVRIEKVGGLGPWTS